jgi:beta-xylosidase
MVEVRLDSINGDKIAEVAVYGTGGWEKMEKFSTDWVKPTTGIHDVYFVFRGRKGPKLFNLDNWTFSRKGTYRNPIINADVPDMSVCRAGDYYYMVSTTMHLMPGAPIMRSRDMKRWETVSYVFPNIKDGDRYDLIDGKSAYGQGQWASSIRYHDGKFYVWFTANGAPGRGFVFTADDAKGPWRLLSRPPHFHDASLLFDDDGRVYLFHSTGQLTELKPDLSDVKPGGLNCKLFERDKDERGLLEGSSVIKRNGKYYLMMISMDWSIPGRLRREVCYRADSITGPYEKRVILETPFESYGGVGQGCIVEGPKGEWYGLIFQDRGGIGRVPCLMPCKWTDDGWPMLGDAQGRIPNDDSLAFESFVGICGSDDFDKEELSLYWQWNHNPIDSAWSLTARPGALRLTTARVVDNLVVAPNTLTQRMTGPTCSGSVCIDLSGMKDGDVAGLAAFNGDSGVLGVEKRGKKLVLVMSNQKSVIDNNKVVTGVEVDAKESVVLKQPKVYLRVDADFNAGKDIATFYYSLDGENWVSIGEKMKMRFDYRRFFMGTRFAIFNYATKQTGGHVDVESFNYKYE